MYVVVPGSTVVSAICLLQNFWNFPERIIPLAGILSSHQAQEHPPHREHHLEVVSQRKWKGLSLSTAWTLCPLPTSFIKTTMSTSQRMHANLGKWWPFLIGEFNMQFLKLNMCNGKRSKLKGKPRVIPWFRDEYPYPSDSHYRLLVICFLTSSSQIKSCSVLFLTRHGMPFPAWFLCVCMCV